MTKFKIITMLLSTVFLMGIFVFPVIAIDYNPGVAKGQYVKYGNFAGIGSGVESFNDYDWLKLEVTEVSGRDVTLLSTGQFKDGTAIPGNGTIEVWNVEAGTQNGIPSTQGPVIAANLNSGDPIPPPNTYSANRTETRTYLGTSRTVVILESTISTPDYNTTLNYVYDRASGMLLESTVETVQAEPATSSTFAYSAIETNVFGSTTGTPSPSPTISELAPWIILSLLVAIALIIGVIIQKRKQVLKQR